MNLFGRKIRGAIERQQVAALEENERFQHLAALQFGKDAGEGGPQLFGGNIIKDNTHLSIARDALEPEDAFEIRLVCLALLIESE